MSKERGKRENRARTGIDYSLLVAVAFLIGFGLVMLYSSSYYTGTIKFDGDSAWFLKKQFVATALSVVALVFFVVVDYRVWKRYTWIIYILSNVLILAVLSPIGMEANGARRWLNFGVMTVQPAEIAKIAVILLMAAVLSTNIKKVNGLVPMLVVFVIALVPTALVFLVTDNFSSAIIIAGIGVIMTTLITVGGTATHTIIFNWKGIALAVVIWVLTNLIKKTKGLHPIVFIALSAIVGIILKMK